MKRTLVTLFILVMLFFFYIFPPNYVEFGPMIKLNKKYDCVDLNDSSLTYFSECSLYSRSVSIYRTNPKTLQESLQEVLNKPLPHTDNLESILSGYPKNAKEWQCAVDGHVVKDNSLEKTYAKAVYQCWPLTLDFVTQITIKY